MFADTGEPLDEWHRALAEAYLQDETTCVESLLSEADLPNGRREEIELLARRLVQTVRQQADKQGGLDAFMREYDLSSEEGVVLMCLAEALLRIPDRHTADRLIHDKLSQADWARHLGHSESLLVNAGTWGLLLTGRLVRLADDTVNDVGALLGRMVARSGEPLVRLALKEAMGIMAHQFVMGRTIEEAIAHRPEAGITARYSYDMLGEAALCEEDAERYLAAYEQAIDAIGRQGAQGGELFDAPGISVKLSALHPRFEWFQRQRVRAELVPRLERLARQAREAGITLTVDAEEADRLGITLEVFEALFCSSALQGWEGLGLAVQTYQKRSTAVLDGLATLARTQGRRIMLRLVKGAYWDSEIKRAQERGLDGYPVFTRKLATDVAYLAGARRLLAAPDAFYPQFATHNAYAVAAIQVLAGQEAHYEFQRLHGMGEALYGAAAAAGISAPCRIYAPVGSHHELLPYLVRRLLENGSNSSFVNRIADAQAPIDSLVADPVVRLAALPVKPHPAISLPSEVFGAARRNSRGLNLYDPQTLMQLATAMQVAADAEWLAAPLVAGRTSSGEPLPVCSPADPGRTVGHVVAADEEAIEQAVTAASGAAADWDAVAAGKRAGILAHAADLLEAHHAELLALCVLEGGRCLPDAQAELREAVDYCRYYGEQAGREFGASQSLTGPTGERNQLTLHGRGVFACISPWNFPLAIFTGQVAAALAAGNAVLAKPASQTPLTAMRVTQLLHQAGVPGEVLHLLPGSGASVGERLISDPRVTGVVFTGSTDTARHLHQRLAQRPGPIAPLIAETGGQNCMIVDSSALPEQVVTDVLTSAFNSAGQRCSALRVLFVQEEIAPRVLELLAGAMAELQVGDPVQLCTDVGPVIDHAARQQLEQHIMRMTEKGRLIYATPLPGHKMRGSYVAPHAFEIDRLDQLPCEVFGPVLHVIRYRAERLEAVLDDINATGYGLTLGIHSRVAETAEQIRRRVRTGNVYVNRNMIGAVVGVQPFGGEGLSGTGPKAGGPYYLHRFASERVFTVNTAAVGGNASLLTLQDDLV